MTNHQAFAKRLAYQLVREEFCDPGLPLPMPRSSIPARTTPVEPVLDAVTDALHAVWASRFVVGEWEVAR